MTSVVARLQQLLEQEQAGSSVGRRTASGAPSSIKPKTSNKASRDSPSSLEASAATTPTVAREVHGEGVSATCGCCIC
jgi:hypothetical protein